MIVKHNVSIPKKWFNLIPVLKEPLPPLQDVVDEKGSRVELMKRIRLKQLLVQDSSNDPYIPIPDKIQELYSNIGRPTPLYRALNLERYLDTPAHIYVKREDVLPTGSFKINTAIPQAYYGMKENVEGLVSETGAGQWGVSLAYACSLMNIKSKIFWVKISSIQKPYRVSFAKLLGADVVPSPSRETLVGRQLLEEIPNCNGSIGISIGEAISFASEHPNYKYVSGSNLTHILVHQSIIGLETKAQLSQLGVNADILVACVGGGSNLGGFMFPFITANRKDMPELIGVESSSIPRLSKGIYKYDHSDPFGLTPKTKSYTLGIDFIPPPIHVGGLRQHNGSPIIASLKNEGILNIKAYSQEEIFEAGKIFIKCEHFIPAPETNHAIKAAIDIALECKKKKEKKNIVLCFSGNGLLDLSGYKHILKL